MKKFLLLFCIPLFFSCSEKSGSVKSESTNILENLSYSTDTVVINAGEDFFNIAYGLGAARLTTDKKTLMFFEMEPMRLVKVDLENLELIRKTDIEKEGPNGVGPYITSFQVGDDKQLFIRSYVTQGIFNQDGELIENLKIVPTGIDNELANDYPRLYNRTIFDFHRNLIYSQPSSEVSNENELFIIDPFTKSAKHQPIPKMMAISNMSGVFTSKTSEGTMYRYFGPASYMDIENEQLLISGGPMSGFYRLNPKTDSVEFIDIKHQKFPNQWDIKIRNEATDEGSFFEDQRKVSEQLNYMDIKWDDSRGIYLRFGKKTFMGENQGDPSTYEIYLFAYDENFNVLGETKIEGLEQVPFYYFWKNGKLYSYVNVDDELGFAIFTFDF